MYGTYLAPLVHFAVAPFLYLAVLLAMRWLERRGYSYWIRVTYPAVVSLLLIALRELADPRGWKTVGDILMWTLGLAAMCWLAHRMDWFAPLPKKSKFTDA